MPFHTDETIADMRMRVREEVSRHIDTVFDRVKGPHFDEIMPSEPPRGNVEKMASRIARFRRKLPSSVGYSSETKHSIRNLDTVQISGKSSDHPHLLVISEIAYVKGLIQAESRRLELLESKIAKQKRQSSAGTPFLRPDVLESPDELHSLDITNSEVSKNCEPDDGLAGQNIGTPSSGTTYAGNSINRQPLTSCHPKQDNARKRFNQRRTIQLKDQADYLRLVSRNISPKSL